MSLTSHRLDSSSSLLGCPATPSPQGVAEFKALYLKHTGVELSDQQALTASTHLLHLLFFGMTPLPQERLNEESAP